MNEDLPFCYEGQTPEGDDCMSENRIDPVAAPAAGSAVAAPGAGGWVPPPWFPLAASVGSATLLSIGAAIPLALTGPVGVLIGAAIMGLGGGLGVFAGVKSAGPRAQG